MHDTALRRQRLAGVVADEGLDAALVTGGANVTYLTGFSGDSSVLVLLRSGRALLVSDRRYVDQIAEECPGLDTFIRPPSQKLSDAVAEAVGKVGARLVGFESGSVTVADFETYRAALPAVDWKPGADRVERLRMVKDDTEQAAIRTAIAIAERAYAALRGLLRRDDSEKDLCDALDGWMRRAGASAAAFPPIVAAGDRAALPHAPPTARRVGDAGLLLVDWGACEPGGYHSDLTRVLAVGPVSDRLRQVYDAVRAGQSAALRAIRPGVNGKDVDAAARQAIAEAGFGDYFGHGLGHGIGLAIHEAPFLRPGTDVELKAGMIFTVEPGVYLPGWGGVRIEDDVLVTPGGVEVLTTAPRELLSVC
jgi:Xaa-Pro aminopeptidase